MNNVLLLIAVIFILVNGVAAVTHFRKKKKPRESKTDKILRELARIRLDVQDLELRFAQLVQFLIGGKRVVVAVRLVQTSKGQSMTNIVSIQRLAGVTTVKTDAPHGILAGGGATLAGISDPSLMGTFLAATVADPQTFTFGQPGSPDTPVLTGGTVAADPTTGSTTVGGTATITPILGLSDGSETNALPAGASIVYAIDNVALASIVTNQDGTATVTGIANGTVNVTAKVTNAPPDNSVVASPVLAVAVGPGTVTQITVKSVDLEQTT